MYKCTDCHKLYEVKPDYCDCGNNLFDVLHSYQEVEEVKSEVQKRQRKSFSEQYPQLSRFINSLDILSVSVFVVCIILSVCALIFIQPVKKAEIVKERSATEHQVQNYPSIDELWKKTKLLPEKVEKIKIDPSVVSEVKNRANSLPKTNVKNKDIKSIKKEQPPSNNTKTDTVKSVEKIVKDVADKVNQTASQTVQPSKPIYDEQLDNYKVALRQALFNNLNVISVSGSGQCVVAFSIDKNGKLMNRAFVQQSPNETVNKAVYNMMMKLPHYYPPPETYKGEQLKLSFAFNNGSYYINYVK